MKRNHGNSPQNARKMQNRLAQREFRARRLEHIKELEARVEFLSKPQSEQTEILVAIIHGELPSLLIHVEDMRDRKARDLVILRCHVDVSYE